MREYSKLSPQFWIGKTGKALRHAGPEAQIVALYLLSSPHANMLGLYWLPSLYLQEETGLKEGALKGLARAVDAGFCKYDSDTEMVWVIEMAEYQIAERLEKSDKRCKGVQKEYESLPDNPFLGDFYSRYSEAFNMSSARGLEGASIPLASQEQEQEQEQDIKPAIAGSLTTDVAADAEEAEVEFDNCPHKAIVALYNDALASNGLTAVKFSMWPNSERATHLRTRWREASNRQSLDWWRGWFEYIAKSDWLMGRKVEWSADLGWLVKRENFIKVCEGKYHG